MTFRALIASLLLLAPASALAGAQEAEPAERFGAPITEKKAAAFAKVAKKPARFVGKTIRLEGTIKEACQSRGCWVEIAGPSGATFFAKSLDETVLVPKDCAGRRVVVQGQVVSQAAKGHDHAKEAGHAEEPGHSCPAPSYLLSTQGIELLPVVAKK